MLITPVQPHNSFNNIILPRQENARKSPSELSPKAPGSRSSIKKKSSTTVSRKTPTRGVDRSVAMVKKRLLSELKYQEKLRKTTAEQMQSVEEHTEELKERKQILSDILKEYEQISKDKNILTAEIKNMKAYLSEIRTKLDQSLTVLNRNTTLFAKKSNLSSALLFSKINHGTKTPTKKKKVKAGKKEKAKSPQSVKDSLLGHESFLQSTLSALKYN